ncbi:hypothetical protein WME91_34515 [Sorangium sp. So ce269]
MLMKSKSSYMIVSLIGLVGFVACMALRGELTSVPARGGLAALAFFFAGLALVALIKGRR